MFAEAVKAYESGQITLTEARIAAGVAPRAARLAYRFPRLFGHLCRLSAADRTRPVYAPPGGWRLLDASRVVRPSGDRWGRGGGVLHLD
jgi:hypothetical protein